MPDPTRPELLPPPPDERRELTPSEQPIMTDGQLGTVDLGSERANPEGSSDLSNLELVGHPKE